ncbi:MAG TPA: glycosyltransferase, partial [Daejeonella sp.]|nr:glycosyltransferase [Daejeonella sp.]
MIKSNNLLILGSVWPEPQSSAAGIRMMQLIKFFILQGWKVTFASAASDSPYCADLSALNVERVTVELNSSDFDRFVRELNPAIVVFDRFMVEEQFGWRVAEQCPNALRILDTEDLHCLRRARQQAFKESIQFNVDDLLTSDVARREIASILRSDLSLIISRFELDLLKKLFNVEESLLFYLPFMTDKLNDEKILEKLSFTKRQNFVTIGNFLHEPNCDSVRFLKEDIWPVIRKALPEAELHIYGAYPVPKITQLHNPKEGFLIKGRANDVIAVMEAGRVCLAPLRFGAGLKGK